MAVPLNYQHLNLVLRLLQVTKPLRTPLVGRISEFIGHRNHRMKSFSDQPSPASKCYHYQG
jgi:hypothetical protein